MEQQAAVNALSNETHTRITVGWKKSINNILKFVSAYYELFLKEKTKKGRLYIVIYIFYVESKTFDLKLWVLKYAFIGVRK